MILCVYFWVFGTPVLPKNASIRRDVVSLLVFDELTQYDFLNLPQYHMPELRGGAG